MEHIVHISFGVHVPLESVASMVSALGACGMIRATDDDQRSHLVTVTSLAKMEYLETQLVKWEQYGFLKYEFAAP
jgi:hypothetical protein